MTFVQYFVLDSKHSRFTRALSFMYSSQQLAEGERAIKEVAQQIQHTYGDVVTFQVKSGADRVPVGRRVGVGGA